MSGEVAWSWNGESVAIMREAGTSVHYYLAEINDRDLVDTVERLNVNRKAVIDLLNHREEDPELITDETVIAIDTAVFSLREFEREIIDWFLKPAGASKLFAGDQDSLSKFLDEVIKKVAANG